uniref:Uncharacterized protein n=2 Tax=Clastoptera arizonana TaxID=38151 RepID=A0A1B6D8A9_9HEMI
MCNLTIILLSLNLIFTSAFDKHQYIGLWQIQDNINDVIQVTFEETSDPSTPPDNILVEEMPLLHPHLNVYSDDLYGTYSDDLYVTYSDSDDLDDTHFNPDALNDTYFNFDDVNHSDINSDDLNDTHFNSDDLNETFFNFDDFDETYFNYLDSIYDNPAQKIENEDEKEDNLATNNILEPENDDLKEYGTFKILILENPTIKVVVELKKSDTNLKI